MNQDIERLTAEAIEAIRRIGAHADDVSTQHDAQIEALKRALDASVRARVYFTGDGTRFTLETDRETDGRWIAEVPELLGCVAYGQDRREAVERVGTLVIRILTEMADRSFDREHDEQRAALEREVEGLRFLLDESTSARAAEATEFALRDQLARLERDLEEMTELAKERGTSIVEIRLENARDMSDAETAITRLREQVSKIETEQVNTFESSVTTIAAWRERVTTLERELAAKTMESAALRQDVEDLRTDRESYIGICAKLRADLSAKAMDHIISEAKPDIRALGESLARELELEQLAMFNRSLREELAATKETLRRALDEEVIEIVEAEPLTCTHGVFDRSPCPECSATEADGFESGSPTVRIRAPRKEAEE